jgi:DNA-directed RNA polymerase subunit beta
VVIDKKFFQRAKKDKKAKGNEKAVLEKIDKEHDKELADLKNELIDKMMTLWARSCVSNGVSNKYKEEQIKKGVKFSAKVLQGWTSSRWTPPSGPRTRRPTNWYAN